MRLSEIYSVNKVISTGFFEEKIPVISFEIFPPKNDESGEKLEKLLSHLSILKKYNPAFISLTYGAGGTTQNSSIEIIKHVKALGLEIMPHFTCVGTSRSQVLGYLNEIQNLGIENILALRGDLQEGMDAKNLDFQYANELVNFIKSETDLSIGVAGYPEGHIDCNDFFMDLKHLKNKVNEGADAIYTQMFFDNEKFFNFVQLAREEGIETPIIPGILPISNYSQLDRMLSMARVTLPDSMKNRLEKYKDSPDDIKKMGIEFATIQCQQLIDSGVSGLHFYTLNSSHSVSAILDNLGIK